MAVCFLDLDGCLVNFVDAALRAHGRTLDPYPAGVWDFDKVLGIEPAAFWAPFNGAFWESLDFLPDGKDVLAAVESICGPSNVCLLTSPCDTAGCASGKQEWIKRHLPDYKRRFLIGPPKEMLARPDAILVDDWDHNIDKWRKTDSVAVQVPRVWNRLHEIAASGKTVDYLRTALGGAWEERA